MKLANFGQMKFLVIASVLCLMFMFSVSYSGLWNWMDDKQVNPEYLLIQMKDNTLDRTGLNNSDSLLDTNLTTKDNTSEKDAMNISAKTILLYNSYYHWKDYMFGLGSMPFQRSCARSDCRTTTNHSELDNADVVVFYGRLLKSVPEIPKRRNDKQLFLYFNTEPPVKGYGDTKRLDLQINITVSYRSDSFIYWPYALTLPKTKADSDYLPLTADQLANKTRPVAWLVSRCDKASTVRSEYATELRKYIEVDIYGRCGNYTCPKREEKECMKLLEERYKFYLAFENSICDDYITEKSFRTLAYNLVPVVMGGGNYTRDLPPHSFIDAREFSSPKQLAQYLDHLSRTPEEYLEYFQWKHRYKISRLERNSAFAFCKLCEILHDPTTRYYSNFNLTNWWEASHCIWPWEKKTKMMSVYHVYD